MSRKDILLAGAIGDAVGYIVEFYRLNKIQKLYGEDGISLSHVPETATLYVSDDTQMTLFTLDAIKNIKIHSFAESKKAYGMAFYQWYYTQTSEIDKCYGLASYKSMQELRAPGGTCLGALTNGWPIKSKGCGGVMRAAPCGFGRDLKNAMMHGAIQARITHVHPCGYLPAAFLAGLISKLEDASVDLNIALDETIIGLKMFPKHEETLAAVELAIKLSKNKTPYEDIPIIGEGWVGEEALGIALYAVLSARNFDECVNVAINHDGDSDSTGSIAAQIYTAAFGLPEKYKTWESRLDIADAFEYVTKDIEELRIENE